MAKPGRAFSVLTKLVLSALLLVTVVVAAVSTLDLIAMLRVYDDAAKNQEEQGRAAILREGRVIAKQNAANFGAPLSENSISLVEEALNQVTKDQKAVLYAVVAQPKEEGVTSDGIILSASHSDKNQEKFKQGAPLKLKSKGKEVTTPEEIRVGEENALLFIAPIVYEEKFLGEIQLAYSLNELEQRIAKIKQEREEATGKSITRSVLVGAMCLFVGLLIAIGQGLQVTRPVRELAQRATQIAGGDLDARVELKSRDEFGHLGATFNHMAERIRSLLQETANKVHLENEMAIARTVQERLVAVPDLIQRGRLQFAGYYQPASFCGGDFWNYLDLGENKTLLIVGDVTGHGVPSALITASAKSCCDCLKEIYGDKLTISQLMQTMNTVIFEAAKRELQMTCFATIVDLEKSQMTFCSAGHPMPYLCRKKDDRYAVQSVFARGNRLGDLPEWNFPAFTMDLESDDVLFVFTDGVTEGEDPSGKQWGEKGLRRILANSSHKGPIEIRDDVVKAAYEFFSSKPPGDDITIVVSKIS